MGIEPFRFDRNKIGQPSSFEFRFLLGQHVFVYGFDATNKQIFGEWLAVLRDEEELTIFERDHEGVTRTEGRSQTACLPMTQRCSRLSSVLTQLPSKESQLFLNRVRSLPESSQGTTLIAIVRWLTQGSGDS